MSYFMSFLLDAHILKLGTLWKKKSVCSARTERQGSTCFLSAGFQLQFGGMKLLLFLGEYHVPQGWEQEAEWLLSKGIGKSFKSRLRRLCVAAAVYHIWKARNRRIFEEDV
ncbi:hypothetical protein Leryth_017889 [Lithospermum erythrorhizon]|nr:hypothetical protein Leryth_017889 [Lithospermum erythrorhizon]